MPTYDYRCKTCQHTFEKLLKISEREEFVKATKCPECKEGEVEQVILSGVGFTSPESLGRKKAPDGFRELMRRMKKAHPGSTIKDH